MRKISVICICLFAISLCASQASAESDYRLQWLSQFGTAEDEGVNALAVDNNGNSYISGITNGNLSAEFAGGAFDAYLAKYGPTGQLLWIDQWGTDIYDNAESLVIDEEGCVYTSGSTKSQASTSSAAYLSKYSPTGNKLWTSTLESTINSSRSQGVVLSNDGYLYISGRINDSAFDGHMFIAKFNDTGHRLWTKTFGNSHNDYIHGMSIDHNNNIIIDGYTNGTYGGNYPEGGDVFAVKFNPTGEIIWQHEFGSPDCDYPGSVATDQWGNIFITGFTDGQLGDRRYGNNDIFLAKYNSDGKLLWTNQLGTRYSDKGFDVAVDTNNNILISGFTEGRLGEEYYGGRDVFFSKFDNDGNLLWTEQMGISAWDEARDVFIDDSNNLYIAGITRGSLGETYAGLIDGFIAKYAIPEPAGLLLLTTGTIALLAKRR